MPPQEKNMPIVLLPKVPVSRNIDEKSDLLIHGRYDAYTFESHGDTNSEIILRVRQTIGRVKVCAACFKDTYYQVKPEDCMFYSVNDLLVIDPSEADQDKKKWIVFVEPIASDSFVFEDYGRYMFRYDITLLGESESRRIEKRGKPIEDYIVDNRATVHTHQFMINQTNGTMFIFTESLSSQKLNLEVSFASIFEGKDTASPGFEQFSMPAVSGVYRNFNELRNLVQLDFDSVRKFCTIPLMDADRSKEPKNRRSLQDNQDVDIDDP